MKLAALGIITAGIGLALDVPALIGIGVYWVVLGVPARLHGKKVTGSQRTDLSPRTFALGTALLLAVGVPPLVVGVLEVGFPSDHLDWRWLLIGVGGAATGVAVVGAVLYLTGSAITASTSSSAATIPANIWIRSVTETGTYINNRPRLSFELTVEPDAETGVAAYDVTKKATTPVTALGRIDVGDGFRALVAGPEAPTDMEIDWEQPLQKPAAPGLTIDQRLAELEQLQREARITDEEYRVQRDRILGSL